MPVTKDDIVSPPGRPELTESQKQAVADQMNIEELTLAAIAADPTPTWSEKIEALMELVPGAPAAAQAKANARRGVGP